MQYFLFVAILCTHSKKNTEACGNITKTFGISQETTNVIDNVGTWIINILSMILIVFIHRWEKIFYH